MAGWTQIVGSDALGALTSPRHNGQTRVAPPRPALKAGVKPGTSQPGTPQGTLVAPGVYSLGQIKSDAIVESSGLVASRRYQGIYWTHNDDKQGAQLYAINREGRTVGKVNVPDSLVEDWEDVAMDDSGNLYIADIGDGGGGRKEIRVHQVAEPNPMNPGDLNVKQTWRLEFPAGAEDAEAFFVLKGFGFVLSKERDKSKVYAFSLAPSTKKIKMAQVGRIDMNAPVTAADVSQDGRKLALLTELGVHLFQINGNMAVISSAPRSFYPYTFVQMEGGCFTRDGFLVTSESSEMFLFNDAQLRVR